MKRIRGDFRPPSEVIANHETPWVHVRLVKKPGGIFVGIDGVEAIADDDGRVMVPGVCVAETRAELAAVIKALVDLESRLP